MSVMRGMRGGGGGGGGATAMQVDRPVPRAGGGAAVVPELKVGATKRKQGTPPSIQGSKVHAREWVCSELQKQLARHKGDPPVHYLEPFAGTLSVMCEFLAATSMSFDTFTASDKNPDLVTLLEHAKAQGAEGLPTYEECTEAAYLRHAEESRDPARVGSAVRGFYGFACSNSREVIYFNGWNDRELASDRYNTREARVTLFRVGLENLHRRIGGVELQLADVFDRPTPKNTLVYADPPYYHNNYDRNPDFKEWSRNDAMREKFWALMQEWSREEHNNVVVVSEYEAVGGGWTCVAELPNPKTTETRRGRRNEKLFMWDEAAADDDRMSTGSAGCDSDADQPDDVVDTTSRVDRLFDDDEDEAAPAPDHPLMPPPAPVPARGAGSDSDAGQPDALHSSRADLLPDDSEDNDDDEGEAAPARAPSPPMSSKERAHKANMEAMLERRAREEKEAAAQQDSELQAARDVLRARHQAHAQAPPQPPPQLAAPAPPPQGWQVHRQVDEEEGASSISFSSRAGFLSQQAQPPPSFEGGSGRCDGRSVPGESEDDGLSAEDREIEVRSPAWARAV
jgi:site-specific DNA-adenine methylase